MEYIIPESTVKVEIKEEPNSDAEEDCLVDEEVSAQSESGQNGCAEYNDSIQSGIEGVRKETSNCSREDPHVEQIWVKQEPSEENLMVECDPFMSPNSSGFPNHDSTERSPIEEDEKEHICPQCRAKFESSHLLIKHLRVHNMDRRFVCPECQVTFKTYPNLKKHLKESHSGESYQCLGCGKVFSREINMLNHRIHSCNRFLSCPECPAKFKLQERLEKHLAVHSRKKTYPCSDCSAAFSNKKELALHRRSHQQERYECTHCPMRFSSKIKLNSHVYAHFGGRPHQCEQCGDRFRTPHLLRNHVATKHSDETPYACSQCSMKFKTKSNIARHVTAHAEEKFDAVPQMSSEIQNGEFIART
ncbi:unnamed protein product [Bemisia tabaci]|uniref:C2H2-type domain-containing protein n=1 Tax=Bemisia tabaci TaxID=7038 RepID=A0A9P0A535_BEMTA|nr:unnamed protein product [Bemisia tabaci]